MANQHEMQDPIKQYSGIDVQPVLQDAPGFDAELVPKADHGRDTYQGSGRLKGRKALITGGDSGIGRAVAIACAREGADIAISFLPEEGVDAKETVRICEEAGVKVVPIPGDISDEEFCYQLVSTTTEELGGLDILVNNAAKQVYSETIDDITTEQLRKTFEVNLFAMFWLSKSALTHIPPGGTIINTTSIQAYQPSPKLLDYAASKAAIVAFTEGLALQVAERGIRVNAVAPGPIWTPLQVSYGAPIEKLQQFGENTPYGRPGQPAELAPTFVFLASQESSYISGQVIGVTGGRLL